MATHDEVQERLRLTREANEQAHEERKRERVAKQAEQRQAAEAYQEGRLKAECLVAWRLSGNPLSSFEASWPALRDARLKQRAVGRVL